MRYIIYLWFLMITSCSSNAEIKYKLVVPPDSGEQYLTVIGDDIYYYGKVKEFVPNDSTEVSYLYFVSKAVNKGPTNNGIDDLSFYDIQYDKNPIGITDLDNLKFPKMGEVHSFEVYSSMWGEIKGESTTLNATKILYDSRIDEIKIQRVE